MSDPFLNSNASSALIASTDAVSVAKNPYEYRYAGKGSLESAHVPAHSRSVSVSQPTGSLQWNSNIDLPVLKAGYLENAFVKIVVSNSTGANMYANPNVMNLMVERLDLITQGKVVCGSQPFGRACLVSNKPYSIKKNLEKALNLKADDTSAIAVGSSYTAYVPCCWFCFDSPELNFNTSFVEPLVCRCKLSASNTYQATSATGDVAAAWTLTSVELIHVFRRLPVEMEQKAISENFGSGEALVKVGYDLIEESTTKTLSAAVSQSVSHTIETNRCLSKLWVAVDSGEGDLSNLIDNHGSYLALSNIKVEANGQTLFDVDGDFVQYCMGSDMDSTNSAFGVGNHHDTSFEHTSNIYCVDFSLGKEPSKLSNAISARELNSFKITATTSASVAVGATQTSARLRVCLQSPMLLSIASASGRISTSLSS